MVTPNFGLYPGVERFSALHDPKPLASFLHVAFPPIKALDGTDNLDTGDETLLEQLTPDLLQRLSAVRRGRDGDDRFHEHLLKSRLKVKGQRLNPNSLSSLLPFAVSL
jgi:hypothetical protein